MSKPKVRTENRPAIAPSPLLKGLVGSAAHLRKEGYPLDLTPDVNVGSGFSGRFSINMSRAPIPQRRYAAELCSVVFAKNEARLIFAQSSLVGDGLESALVLRMSPPAINQLADSLREASSPTVDEVCAQLNIVSETLSEITASPQQVANMVANICAIAYSGHESCLDFYHASAFANKKAQSTKELEVEPVVRVDLRTALLVPLIARIMELDKVILEANTGEQP